MLGEKRGFLQSVDLHNPWIVLLKAWIHTPILLLLLFHQVLPNELVEHRLVDHIMIHSLAWPGGLASATPD